MSDTLDVKVLRHNPAGQTEPAYVTYRVPRQGMGRLLDVLAYIYERLDPTLGYRRDVCRDGVCQGCLVKMNDRTRLACLTPIAAKARELVLEPVANYGLIRDLVVDFSSQLRDEVDPDEHDQ